MKWLKQEGTLKGKVVEHSEPLRATTVSLEELRMVCQRENQLQKT